MIAPAVSSRDESSLISVVLPQFNEVEVLQRLLTLVETALQSCAPRYEIIFVNDGSTDGSSELLDEMAAANPCVRVLHFSRNFGHQAAVQAGLAHAAGAAVVVMDSDLQDDPLAICEFVRQWRAGFDVVYAERTKRKESAPKRLLFYSFYRVLNAISDTPIPNDAGNFGLMDRQVVDAVLAMGDADRYFPGLRRWVGFRQIGVPVERLARHDECPRVSLRGLFRLAKSAVFSFSCFPLTMFYIIAAVSGLVCCGFVAFTLYHKFVTGLAIAGWTSGIITASFFGAMNALGISILGEYVVRIYDQVRARPDYVIRRTVGAETNVPQESRPEELLDWLAEARDNAAADVTLPQ